MSSLILPGDPLFNMSLATLPPGWRSADHPRFICRPGSCGLLEQVDEATYNEYLYGGEFEIRSEELGDEDEDVVYFDF